jgi:hypothetical protein
MTTVFPSTNIYYFFIHYFMPEFSQILNLKLFFPFSPRVY